ncbi:MAG: hypothetical protein AAGD35_12945 [Actinomycetota bacterium]
MTNEQHAAICNDLTVPPRPTWEVPLGRTAPGIISTPLQIRILRPERNRELEFAPGI